MIRDRLRICELIAMVPEILLNRFRFDLLTSYRKHDHKYCERFSKRFLPVLINEFRERYVDKPM